MQATRCQEHDVDINLTLIGQSIAMLVFVWFCMKFIWPPVMKAIEERQTQIADGLAAAERGQQSLDRAKAESGQLVDEAPIRAVEQRHRGEARRAAQRQRPAQEVQREAGVDDVFERLQATVVHVRRPFGDIA